MLKEKTILFTAIVLMLMIVIAMFLLNYIEVTVNPPRPRANKLFTTSPIDNASYNSLAGTSIWRSLKTVNIQNPNVTFLLDKLRTMLFNYNWARNQSLFNVYRVRLVDSNGVGPATRVILFNDPMELYKKYGLKNINFHISIYDQMFKNTSIKHSLSGIIRMGKILLPHGVEIILLAIVNNDNIIIGYDDTKIYNITTLKFIIYAHPYNLDAYKFFLEVHKFYGKPPPIGDVYKEKVKPGKWRWVLYKTFIISNKPSLVLENNSRIYLEYIAILEEYPYTGCSTEILWSLFYRSLVFSLALNLALPANTSEAEYYYYALKTASKLMVYKPYYYPKNTLVYCLPELARIGGFCYEHSITGMEVYNLVFRLPYFILFMHARVTGLGHSVGIVVIPSIYVNKSNRFTILVKQLPTHGRELLFSGIDFDDDGSPDFILEVVNTGGTSIYEKMAYHPGELLFLLEKNVIWGLDHYYPFKYVIETPYGDFADISYWSGLEAINNLLKSHPWFKLPYYNRSEKMLSKIHELEEQFILNRAGIPTVGTPARYNISTKHILDYDQYLYYVIASRVTFPPIPMCPSNIDNTCWIPVILVIKTPGN